MSGLMVYLWMGSLSPLSSSLVLPAFTMGDAHKRPLPLPWTSQPPKLLNKCPVARTGYYVPYPVSHAKWTMDIITKTTGEI
jgi:hypothetical protein